MDPCGREMSCGKNALSVLRDWKKPYVKTSMFPDIHRVVCEYKMLTVTSHNMTLCILFTMKQ